MVYIDLTKVSIDRFPVMLESICALNINKISAHERELLEIAQVYAYSIVEDNDTFISCRSQKGYSMPLLENLIFETFICTQYMAYFFANEIRELIPRLVNQIAMEQFKTKTPSVMQLNDILYDLLEIRHLLYKRQNYDRLYMTKLY